MMLRYINLSVIVEFDEHPIIETGGIALGVGHSICPIMKKSPMNNPSNILQVKQSLLFSII